MAPLRENPDLKKHSSVIPLIVLYLLAQTPGKTRSLSSYVFLFVCDNLLAVSNQRCVNRLRKYEGLFIEKSNRCYETKQTTYRREECVLHVLSYINASVFVLNPLLILLIKAEKKEKSCIVCVHRRRHVVACVSLIFSLKMTHPPLPSSQLGEQDQLPTACRLTCDVLHCTIRSTTSFYTFAKNMSHKSFLTKASDFYVQVDVLFSCKSVLVYVLVVSVRCLHN